MIYVIDIDGTLCTEDEPNVADRKPHPQRIAMINRLVDEGHSVDIYTSRGMKSTGDDPVAADAKYRKLTEQQLAEWGVKYNRLYMGKPNADLYVDNKNGLMDDFFKELN
jgi:hypothetical protein